MAGIRCRATHPSDLDCMTSSDSTAVYSEPELNKLLGYVRETKQVGGNYGFSACIVGKSNGMHTLSVPHGFLRSLDEFLQ